MLEWFTTIPGVLVICGVVLLIIAIVLFVMGSKKGKTVPVNNEMCMNRQRVRRLQMPTIILHLTSHLTSG